MMRSNKVLARKILCGLLAAGVVGACGSVLAKENFTDGVDISTTLTSVANGEHCSGQHNFGAYAPNQNISIDNEVSYKYILKQGSLTNNSGVSAVFAEKVDNQYTYNKKATFYVETDIIGSGNSSTNALAMYSGHFIFNNDANFTTVAQGKNGKSAYGLGVMGYYSPASIKFNGNNVNINVNTETARQTKDTYCEAAGISAWQIDLISEANTKVNINVNGSSNDFETAPIYGILNEAGYIDFKGDTVINVTSSGDGGIAYEKYVDPSKDKSGTVTGIKIIDGSYNTTLGHVSGHTETHLNNVKVKAESTGVGTKAAAITVADFNKANSEYALLDITGNADIEAVGNIAYGIEVKEGTTANIGSDSSDMVSIKATSTDKDNSQAYSLIVSDKGVINVKGKTVALTGDILADGGTINLAGATNTINGNVQAENGSKLSISGQTEITKGLSLNSAVVTVNKGSQLKADVVSAEGGSFTADGNVEANNLKVSSGADLTLNGGGTVSGLKQDHHSDDPVDAGLIAADVAIEVRGGIVKAAETDFVGEISVSKGSEVELTGGSVTSGRYYYDETRDNFVEERATEIGVKDSSKITLNNVKLDTNLGAFDGGVITVNNSDVNAKDAIYAENSGTINLNSTNGNAKYNIGGFGIQADGGIININGGTVNTSDFVANNGGSVTADKSSIVNVLSSVKANTGTIDFQGKLTAKGIVAENGSKITLAGGTITGAEVSHKDEDGTVNRFLSAAEVSDKSTLSATNVAFIGDLKAKSGSQIILKGGSVTASDYYINDEKDGYTEFGAEGKGSSIMADGVDIKSATVAADGATVTISNSSINTVEGIWADGDGSAIILNGTGNNVYTVGDGFVAVNGGKIYINGGNLEADNLHDMMYGIKDDNGKTIESDAKGIVLDAKGVISTMSDQIYANKASVTQNESGVITNKGINFKGGTLILNDAQYTYAYGTSAQGELSKQGVTTLTMKGELVDDENGKVKEAISVDAASQFGSNTELDKVTATAGGNLLVGLKDASLAGTTVEGVTVKTQVENGFAVRRLALGADSVGVIITNNKEVTLGGSEGGSLITVDGEDKEVKVVVGTNEIVSGAKNAQGSLKIGNTLANNKTQYKLNGEIVVNKDSKLSISGETEITKGLSLNSAVVTVNKGSQLKADVVSAEGGSFTADGNVEANNLKVSSGADVTLNGGGTVSGLADISAGSSLKADSVEFAGIKAAGSKTNVELSNVKVTSDLCAFDNSVVTVNASNISAAKDIHAEGGTINLNGTEVKANSLIANSGSVIADASSTANVVSVKANAGTIDFRGTLTAKDIVAENGSKITLAGGKVSGAEVSYTDEDGTVNKFLSAAAVSDKSTLSATNIDFTGDLKAENGSKIVLKGGSVTASDYYVNGEKDGYTEFGAEGEGSSITADGVDIKSEIFAADGAMVTINNSDIKTVEGIGADGTGSQIILNGSGNNVYTVGNGFAAVNGGKIYINGGTLKADNLRKMMYGITDDDGKTIASDAKGIVLDAKGVISTISDQIYANAASATQKESGSITNDGIDFQGGTLVLNDEQYTLGYSKTALAELNQKGNTKLVMSGKLVTEAGEFKEEISVDDASNVTNEIELDKVTAKADNNLLVGSINNDNDGKEIDGVTIQDKVKTGFSVASLELGAGSDGIVITNNETVILGGSQGGSLITVKDDANKKVKVVVGTSNNSVAGANSKAGNLNIGNTLAKADTEYELNGEVVVNQEGALNVNGKTNVTDKVTLKGGEIKVNKGALNTAELSMEDNAKVIGEVNATVLTGTKDKILAVGNKDDAGRLTVDEAKLNGGTLFLDPAWQDGATISDASGLAVKNIKEADGAYVVGQNSVLALGADLATAEGVFAKTEQTWGKDDITAAAYIASTINVANGSLTVDGALTASPTAAIANGSLAMAANSLLMVDGTATKDTAAVTGVSNATVDASSKLYIDNAKKGETYKILAGNGIASGWDEANIISSNSLLKFTKVTDDTKYDVTASVQSVKDAFGGEVIAPKAYYAALNATGENAASDFIMNAADSKVNATKDAQVSALNSAAAMSELAGVSHGTYATSNLLTDAVADHMSLANAKEHDSDIWAKYIHTKEDVDGLSIASFGADYDAQYNGIVVGADLYKNGKATIGAALTYVDGNINGNTLAARTKNDATYYGASIYGGIASDDSAVIGDISYLYGKNDITQYNSGATLTADAKSDAFSIGVRAEKSVKAGVGKFVPYAGIRYMHLGTGNYTNSIGMSYDADDMNLWLLPVGVKYSADVKAGDWTIRPIAEVGYVWNMGDRDSTQTVSLNGASDGFDYDVTDSGSYIGRFMIEAEKANVTYGLGYEYQKGDSVKANRWMANLNWKF